MTENNPSRTAAGVSIGVSNSRRLHGSIIAGLLVVTGLGTFLLGESYIPDNELIGMVCGGMAAVVLIVSRGAWTEGVAMTINEDGIWYRDWNLPVVPWNHIGRVYATGIRLRPLLRIDLDGADDFFEGLDDSSRRDVHGNPLVKPNHLLVPNGALALSISEIVTVIGTAAARRSAGRLESQVV